MLPRLVRELRGERLRTCGLTMRIAAPWERLASRWMARRSPRAACAAKNCFQEPGWVSTLIVRQCRIVALSFRSAAFLCRESAL